MGKARNAFFTAPFTGTHRISHILGLIPCFSQRGLVPADDLALKLGDSVVQNRNHDTDYDNT